MSKRRRRIENEPIERALGRLLRQKKLTLAVAESCTGGLLAKHLTDCAGSSDYFLGGVIAYRDRVKEDLLGVSHDALRRWGAVSQKVAVRMAEGVRRRCSSDLAVGITGIAGPWGASRQKPVGLVWVALAHSHGVISKSFHFLGSRHQIRQQAAVAAMRLLNRYLRG